MKDAVRAHAFFESGQLREIWGDDPPAHLPAAVDTHERAITLTIDRDRPKKNRRGDPFAPDGGDRP